MFLESIEQSHVLDIVDKLKPTKLVKETIAYIIEPLTHIKTGMFPDKAKVIPIHKSSDTDQLKNDRPISFFHFF